MVAHPSLTINNDSYKYICAVVGTNDSSKSGTQSNIVENFNQNLSSTPVVYNYNVSLPSTISDNINISILWASDVTTGNVIWKIGYQALAQDDIVNSSTWSVLTLPANSTSTQANGLNIASTTLTGMADKKILSLKIYRDYSETIAADANVYLLGILLEEI